MPQPTHPFFPPEANVVGYLANQYSVVSLLGIFALGCAVVLGGTLMLLRRYSPRLPAREKASVMWFVSSGAIHLFFEGYFAYNHATMPGRQDIFGQLWKEYAKSDSRYMTSDPFVLCMESVTAVFWGPLSFWVALAIATGSPLRHPLQIIVSLGQIYGDVLYYATSMFDLYYKNLIYCRPEAYYFWFYFVAMNFIWIVVPGVHLLNSIKESARVFQASAEGLAGPPKANGIKKSQ